MSARHLLRLAIALGVLLAIWGAVALGSRNGDREQRFRLPPSVAKDLDTVSFAGVRDTIVLARAGADAWRVNGHAADRRRVEELLNSLADTAASGDIVAESPSSYAQVGMDSASARRVRAVAHGKTVTDVVVGKAGQVYGTGYVRPSSESRVYLVRSALPSLATRPLDEWRDRRIGGVAKDSIARVEIQRGAKRYALGKQAGRWTLVPADSLKFAPAKRRLTVLGQDGKPRLQLRLRLHQVRNLGSGRYRGHRVAARGVERGPDYADGQHAQGSTEGLNQGRGPWLEGRRPAGTAPGDPSWIAYEGRRRRIERTRRAAQPVTSRTKAPLFTSKTRIQTITPARRSWT